MSKVNWGESVKLDKSFQGGIALNASGMAVEVRQGASELEDDLYYRVGAVDYATKRIDWGEDRKFDSGVSKNPKVAISGNTVVEVHDNAGIDVFYRVGILDPAAKKIAWGDVHKYDTGRTPSVALTSAGVAVEIHGAFDSIEAVATLGFASQNQLFYRVGTVDAAKKTIAWGDSHKFDDGPSLSPYVAVNDSGVVMEVHTSGNYYKVWYHVGTLDAANKKISWGDSHKYDDGYAASVALNADGTAVEVHRNPTETISDMKLWYRVGTVDRANKKVSWGDSHKYDDGQYPWVAMNGAHLVELHKSENEDRLWYHVGELAT